MNKARGGLDVGLHPALLGDAVDTSSTRRGKVAPKFATTMANRRSEPKSKKQLDLRAPSPDLTDPSKNPYFDPSLGTKPVQRRFSKALVFNPKGKYIEQANALRRQEALEEMKKRIALAARKAGIDEDMHADKAFAVSARSSVLPIKSLYRVSILDLEPGAKSEMHLRVVSMVRLTCRSRPSPPMSSGGTRDCFPVRATTLSPRFPPMIA